MLRKISLLYKKYSGPIKLGTAVLAGIVISQVGGPPVRHMIKYFSLSGYKTLKHYKLPETPKDGIPNFSLIDTAGEAHELYRMTDSRAIVFIAHTNDCPILQKYTQSIVGLKKEYETRDTKFFMLNSNFGDTKDAIIAQSHLFPLSIPILLDPSQLVAKSLGITRSAEAVVVDPKTWKVVYRGAIDDMLTYGGDLPQPRNPFLRNALEDFLHDRPVRQMDNRVVMGCAITFKHDDEMLTYTKDAGPIMAQKCLFCHTSAFGTKPYLTDYGVIKNWTAMIRDTLMTHRMPPWGWDMSLKQHYHQNYDPITLTSDDLRILVSWIDAGAPRGPGQDPMIQAVKFWEQRKRHIPPPDLEYTNQEILVPPKGYNEYQYYQVGGPTEEDMWVVGTNLRSTNAPTIHHQMMIVTAKPLSYYRSRVSNRRDEELVEEDDTGNVPAWELHQMRMDNYENNKFIRIQVSAMGLQQPQIFAKAWGDQLGFFIPKGAYITLETHYHGTGKPEPETSTLGLYIYKGHKQMHNIISGRVTFINKIEIPPGAEDAKIVADPIVLKKKSGLLALGLHMHMRGKSAQYIATYPDGHEELLASHPFFNYNTSTARGIAFPPDKIFPAGTTIRVECHYDNTVTNPYNPNPNIPVHWGQTLDRSEMCMGYVWSYDVDDDFKPGKVTQKTAQTEPD